MSRAVAEGGYCATHVQIVDRAIERISERPEAGSPYLSSTKRVLLRRFPLFVVYRVRNEHVQIVAVAHARRRPGYWRARGSRARDCQCSAYSRDRLLDPEGRVARVAIAQADRCKSLGRQASEGRLAMG